MLREKDLIDVYKPDLKLGVPRQASFLPKKKRKIRFQFFFVLFLFLDEVSLVAIKKISLSLITLLY